MGELSELAKNRIREVLGATSSDLDRFTLMFDDENSPPAVITFSSSPEYRFVISSTENGGFTTSESPGIDSNAEETFHRSEFSLCLNALKKWVERIDARQGDWILDEFGGVADSNPSYK